jgi:hypothetical protein
VKRREFITLLGGAARCRERQRFDGTKMRPLRESPDHPVGAREDVSQPHRIESGCGA